MILQKEGDFQIVSSGFGVLLIISLFSTTECSGDTPMGAGTAPRFLVHPHSQVVKQHGKALLECTASPADSHITWLYEGQPVFSDPDAGIEIQGHMLHILSFRHTKRERGETHEGVYMCVANNEVGTVISQAAILERAFMGQFAGDLEDSFINATSGNTALIPCQPPKGTPTPRITFQLDGEAIDLNSGRHMVMPSGNLQIRDVKQSDEGLYRCVSVNPVSGQRRVAPNSVHFKVITPTQNIPPRFVQNPEAQYEVIAGEDLTLECVVQGSPVPYIMWDKHEGGLPQSRIEQVWGNLIIRDVQLLDQGTFICRAENGVGPPTAAIAKVSVIEPPSIRIPPADQIAVEGATVHFQCLARGRGVQTTWFYNGQPVASSEHIDVTETSLTITRVTKEQSGIYQCVARSKLGQVTEAAHLQVKGQGEIDFTWLTHPSIAVLPGMSSESIDSSESNPTPAPPIMSPNDRGDDYDTPPAFDEDMVPPSAPEVSKHSDNSAMLRWTVPENDGLPISFFKIQYRDISARSREDRQWHTVEINFLADVREAEVRRLEIGSIYKFRVLAVFSNDDNAWGKNSRRFQLEPDRDPTAAAPVTQPIIVELRSFGVDNLALRWQYQSQDISPIDGFYVYYRPYGSSGDFKKDSINGSERRHYNLYNLDPNTHYSVEIASFNSAGSGPRSIDVVEKTLEIGSVSQKPGIGRSKNTYDPPLRPTWPPRLSTTTRAPYSYIPRDTHNANNEMLYVVLGVVLGFMLLVLFIFMLICWRKQRKQRRRMEHEDDSAKFGDPSKTIYADSIRKQHVNGGTNFLLSDLGNINKPNQNGGGPPIRNGSLGNGHVTTSMGFVPPTNGGEAFTMTANPLNEYDETYPGVSGEQDLEHLRASLQQAFRPPSFAPPPPDRGVASYTAAEYARHPHPHNPYFEVEPSSDTMPRVHMGTFGCRDCNTGSRPLSRADDPYTSGTNQYAGVPNTHHHPHLHSNAPPPEYNSLNLRPLHRLSGSDYPDYSGSLRKPKTNPHMGYDSGYRASPDHIPRSHERPYRHVPTYDNYSRNGQYAHSPGGQKMYDPYNGSSQDTAYGSAHDQSGNMSDVYEQLGSEKSYSSSSQVSGRPKVRRKNKKPYIPVAALHSENDLPDNPPQLSSPAEAPPQLPPRNTPPSLTAMPISGDPAVNQVKQTPLTSQKPIPASRNKLLPRQASNSSSSDNNTGKKNQSLIGDSSRNSHELLDAPSSGTEQCGTENGGSMSPQISLSTDPRNLESDLDIDQINVSDNEGCVFTGAEMTDSHISSSVIDDDQDDLDDNDLLDNEMVSSSHPLFSTPAGNKYPTQLSAHERFGGGSPVASPIAMSLRNGVGSAANPESQPLMGNSKHRNIPRVNDYPSDDENEDS